MHIISPVPDLEYPPSIQYEGCISLITFSVIASPDIREFNNIASITIKHSVNVIG